MKNPKTALLALVLALALWAVTKSAKSHQSAPLEILAVGQPIDCGKVEEHLVFLRKRWEIDKRIIKQGLVHPVFIEDWKELRYYEDLFLLIPCART